MDYIITELMKIFPSLNAYLAGGIFIFARLLGFFRLAPVFNRKEMPGMIKIALILLITIVLTGVAKPQVTVIQSSFVLTILLNFVVGAMIGYVAQLILLAVDAGGDMINADGLVVSNGFGSDNVFAGVYCRKTVLFYRVDNFYAAWRCLLAVERFNTQL